MEGIDAEEGDGEDEESDHLEAVEEHCPWVVTDSPPPRSSALQQASERSCCPAVLLLRYSGLLLLLFVCYVLYAMWLLLHRYSYESMLQVPTSNSSQRVTEGGLEEAIAHPSFMIRKVDSIIK